MANHQNTIVGQVSASVATALGITLPCDTNIYMGIGNIQHMINRHPNEYLRYGTRISEILSSPDYVGQNPKDGSIEYVKEFQINGEFVKVAVRLSGGARFYARSLYVLNPNRVQNFIQKGTLKKP